mmetsp:Transcript_15252/g.36534  ORF Transcript_15252/g.36534 Transcript_15252/m.36534 type:complete len:292 (-) Transcript_15252:320-1195(-)
MIASVRLWRSSSLSYSSPLIGSTPPAISAAAARTRFCCRMPVFDLPLLIAAIRSMYLSTLRVSETCSTPGLRHARTMEEHGFSRESLSILVSVESRYGTYVSRLASAVITFPRASSPWLMFFPAPSSPSECFSEPARSMRCMHVRCDCESPVEVVCLSMYTVRKACEREDKACMPLAATARRDMPRSIMSVRWRVPMIVSMCASTTAESISFRTGCSLPTGSAMRSTISFPRTSTRDACITMETLRCRRSRSCFRRKSSAQMEGTAPSSFAAFLPASGPYIEKVLPDPVCP